MCEKRTLFSTSHMLSVIRLDRANERPLYWQIYESLRQAILKRQLEAGAYLPSSRDLAKTLAVSRNTVRNAFDQLMAEGYLETQVGSGTFVTTQLPDETLSVWQSHTLNLENKHQRILSGYGTAMDQLGRRFPLGNNLQVHPLFAIGIPDMTAFPFDIWFRLTNRCQKKFSTSAMGQHQSPLGYWPLRVEIARYLRAARAIQCEPEQIIIVSGTQKSIYLTAQILLNEGDSIWMEEPGYTAAMGAMWSIGATINPVPVDLEGLRVETGIELYPEARLAYVTPSHQYPLGDTMSLPRRLMLLNWAEENGRWIIEDDYDSAYRYDGPPLPALQGLDQNGRVIYLGTFSKVMFPTLRLSYLVIPQDLIHAYRGALIPLESYPPLLSQTVLTEFMHDGHFARHIRRMRKLYGQKRNLFRDLVRKELGDFLTLGPNECGMHAVGFLPKEVSETAITQLVKKDGFSLTGLSSFYQSKNKRDGLLLSFTSASQEEIQEGVRYLAQIFHESKKFHK